MAKQMCGDRAATASAPVLALAAAVDALVAQEPGDLPGPQALAEATALVRELERLRSVVLTRVADVDARTLNVLADAPSTGTWLHSRQTSLTRALPPVAGSGARLPRSLVRAWWRDSAVTRFVLDLGHRVVETSHTERTLEVAA